MEIIVGRKGNQKIPIEDTTVSRQHCKITSSDNVNFIVEDLNSTGGTWVDGNKIIKTKAGRDSMLRLGPSFKIKLADLVSGFSDNTQKQETDKGKKTGQEPPTFKIGHLQKIWEEFNKKNTEIAEKQRKINMIRTGLGLLTMCAFPIIFFFGPIGYIFTGIGIVGNVYSFVGMRNVESPADRQYRQEAFDEAWVCPNPHCDRTIPAKNYRMLLKNYKSCPFCKCKYEP